MVLLKWIPLIITSLVFPPSGEAATSSRMLNKGMFGYLILAKEAEHAYFLRSKFARQTRCGNIVDMNLYHSELLCNLYE